MAQRALRDVPPSPPLRSAFGKNLVNWLFPAYVLLIASGFGGLLSGFATTRGNELGSDRCLFHAINAATLTGFPATIGVREFNGLGQGLTLLMMAGGTLFSFVVGGLAMVRILRLRFSDARVIAASFTALIAAAVFGTIGGVIGGLGKFDALFLSVSAFSNAGLTAGTAPAAAGALTHLLLLPLAILGGLGVTVLMELVATVRKRTPLSSHARTTIKYLAAVYVMSFILLIIVRWPRAGVDAGGATSLIAATSAMSFNARSLGFPLEYATSLSRTVQWLLIVLMTIGAGSSSTAGGLKVTTLAEIFRGVRRALRGDATSRAFGIAMVWLGLFAGIVLLTHLLLLHQLTGMPADRVLFLSVSAVSNVGMVHDPLSITYDGLYTLSAAMFAGRVVPLLVLWWMADTTTDADVAIG